MLSIANEFLSTDLKYGLNKPSRIVTGTVVKSVNRTLGPHDNSNPHSVSKGHCYREVVHNRPQEQCHNKALTYLHKREG